MNAEDDIFEKVSDRISQSKGDCAILLIDRIVEALINHGVKIDTMRDLCASVVSGQFNDPAAQYALADFTHDVGEADMVKKSAMRLMIEDERQERPSET